ncbi:hypothetical protein PHAVU_007G006100 [Phaseolus vulgaris]|uniref:HMG box domain-containing protein n=1 Tax=Phaseolus vulgaris TaxID=3885 RepID=V7B9W4_PHAVU|nr:hypothetical protein PHAVU_007G006100g [Phaseolus vulgaris]ESW14657.1 hypothetical protein PHAVU_007G006100g [Phaseolus vulgaris]
MAAESAVVGVIDGKFESGYIVRVRMGSETLKGIVYEVAEEHESVHNPPQRKRSEMKKRVPVHPKHSRSGYNFFFAEQHAKLKPLHQGKEGEIPRIIGELWSKLKLSQKMIYQEMAMKDKERYIVEMEDYVEKLKMGPIITDAVPLRQWPPKPDTEMLDVESGEEGFEDRGFGVKAMPHAVMEIETNYLGSKENSPN